MVVQLPIVQIGEKKYFVDERLNELRNVEDPSDREKMEGSKDFYVKHFGVDKKSELKAEELGKRCAEIFREIEYLTVDVKTGKRLLPEELSKDELIELVRLERKYCSICGRFVERKFVEKGD